MGRTAALFVLGIALTWWCPLMVGGVADPFCRLLLHEEQNELEDLELEQDLEQSRLGAAQEIFKLLDALWKNDAVERMVYLAGKHDRDATKLEVDRRIHLVKRQGASIEQYRILCATLSAGETSEDQRRSLNEAYLRYRRADCDALAAAVDIAGVDLEYQRELLASVVDLRKNNVATRQDVVFAERNVEMGQKRLEQDQRRLRQCRDEIGGAE